MKATIDRIEDDIAVLISSEDEPSRITLPALLLPRGSKEGDTVTISIERYEQSSTASKDRVSSLIDKLKNK
ncbi:MAG: DUF3006 domain-containing protein [Methanoregula sp.]